MNARSERPSLDPSVWGYTLIAAVFLFTGLIGVGGTLADRIVSWPLIAVGIFCLFSAWKDWHNAESAYRDGLELEARIVGHGRPPYTLPVLPQALGVVFRRLRLEYEVDGRTVVSEKLVPERFVRELGGRATVTVRVLPARPRFWVPAG